MCIFVYLCVKFYSRTFSNFSNSSESNSMFVCVCVCVWMFAQCSTLYQQSIESLLHRFCAISSLSPTHFLPPLSRVVSVCVKTESMKIETITIDFRCRLFGERYVSNSLYMNNDRFFDTFAAKRLYSTDVRRKNATIQWKTCILSLFFPYVTKRQTYHELCLRERLF